MLTHAASPLPHVNNNQRAHLQQVPELNTAEDTIPVHSQDMNTIKISFDDIEDEIRYWESAVVCYVIGANPPLHVIDGYMKTQHRRRWSL